MGRIYSKAHNEELDKLLQELLNYAESVADQENEKELVLQKINSMRRSLKEQEAGRETYEKHPWDFSLEKAMKVLTSDGSLDICPICSDNKVFYCGIRRYWLRMNGMESIADQVDDDAIWQQTQEDSTFYCTVKLSDKPIGYVAIKDTRESIWEIVAEFDPSFCNKGYGTKSIMLFLKAVQDITMCDLYCAKIEVENIASQKCFTKLGAELIGITNGAIEDEEEKAQFENENLDRIDANMIKLAERLQIEPRKLLSHVLEYHLMI